MKKIALLASISQLALIASGGADAQTLPRRAPPMVAAAPVYSWTGCYVGAHLGYGWGRQQVSDSNFSYGPGSTTITRTNTLESDGGIFGGQAGCNYQFASNWVVGIQGDVAGADLRGTVADPFNGLFDPTLVGTIGLKTDLLASLTARLGVAAWDNRALFYVKGGAAWVDNKWDFSRSVYCNPIFVPCRTPTASESRTGWTVGAGLEWVLSPSWSNWTAFAEYNYYGFGNGPTFLEAQDDPRNNSSVGKQNIQVVKFGINYKLFTP